MPSIQVQVSVVASPVEGSKLSPWEHRRHRLDRHPFW